MDGFGALRLAGDVPGRRDSTRSGADRCGSCAARSSSSASGGEERASTYAASSPGTTGSTGAATSSSAPASSCCAAAATSSSAPASSCCAAAATSRASATSSSAGGRCGYSHPQGLQRPEQDVLLLQLRRLPEAEKPTSRGFGRADATAATPDEICAAEN